VSSAPAVLISRSPWDGAVVCECPSTTAAAVAAALDRLAQAFPGWSPAARLPARREGLQRFATVLRAARAEIVAALVREAGKCQSDAQAEADLLPRKIEISLDAGLTRTPLGGEPLRFRPRGVAACIGPFNFPLHLLHGLVVPALAVGCTVLAKPSERLPAIGGLYARLAAQSGLDEVLQVVLGGAVVASQAALDERVMTVAAVGGQAMGRALAQLLAARPHAVLALELGGVNQALVLDDADQALSVAAIAEGAWRMAGQRCTATRIVHVPRAQAEALTAQLLAARGAWTPATPEGPAGMMISAQAREDFQRPFRVLPAGLRLLAGAPSAPAGSCRAEPLVLTLEQPSARRAAVYREEQFGPMLIIDPYDDPAECCARLAANPYRLSASVFTASRERFRICAEQLPYGLVNWNRSTAGARSDLPFGGTGASGNGRPAALAAGALFADETVVWE